MCECANVLESKEPYKRDDILQKRPIILSEMRFKRASASVAFEKTSLVCVNLQMCSSEDVFVQILSVHVYIPFVTVIGLFCKRAL